MKEEDIEDFLEAVPEELTSKELLELTEKCVGEEETRAKETAGKEKEEPQENSY